MITRTTSSFFLTLSFLIASATAACGSDGDASTNATDPVSNAAGTTPGGTCESANSRICSRACACSKDGKCHVAVKTAGGAFASLSFDSEAKCRDLYVVAGCTGREGATSSEGIDYGACDAELQAASCVDSAAGGGVPIPETCRSKE